MLGSIDAKILADLLRSGLVYQSYVPSKEFREKRSLIRHRISLVRNRTLLENKVHSLLDKYDYKIDLTDIFGRSGMCWLKGMESDPIDKVIMDTTISSIENINTQIGIVSREIFRYAWESEDVKLILSKYYRNRCIFCHAYHCRNSRHRMILYTMEACKLCWISSKYKRILWKSKVWKNN